MNFIKERVDYSPKIIDLSLQFLFSSAYAVVIYTLTSQPMDKPHVHVFAFLPICVLTSFVSYSLGLLIAVELSGKTNTMHGIVSLAIVVPVVLLTGFILDFNLLSNYFKWLTWISYVRYAFDGKENAAARCTLQTKQYSIDIHFKCRCSHQYIWIWAGETQLFDFLLSLSVSTTRSRRILDQRRKSRLQCGGTGVGFCGLSDIRTSSATLEDQIEEMNKWERETYINLH